MLCANCKFQRIMPRYAMETLFWRPHPHTCELESCECNYVELHVPADSKITWTHEYFREVRVGPENAK